MKIQLSPTRIIADPSVIVIWQEQGPDVQIVMDLKNLTFAPNSLEVIYAFHVLDHFYIEEAQKALNNWFQCLRPRGIVFSVVDNFEFLARSFVGGDISIEDVNKNFVHPSQYTVDNSLVLFRSAGFPEPAIRMWYGGVPNLFTAQNHELVMSADKL